MVTRRFETDYLLGIVTGYPSDRYDLRIWLLDYKSRPQVLDQLSSLKFPVQIEESLICICVAAYCLTYQQAETLLKWANQTNQDSEEWPTELEIRGD